MRSLAAIEIKPRAGGALPVKLIKDAYRASRRGRIILMLDGVDWDRVDEVLDPLVRTMRVTIPGLVYVDVDNGPSVRAAMRQSCSIYVSKAGQFARLQAGGVQTRPLAEVPSLLARLCRPTRIAEIGMTPNRKNET